MNDERDAARSGLDELYADHEPPPELEERIVASYARSRASRGTARSARWLQLAAGVVLLLGGYAAGRLGTRVGQSGAGQDGGVDVEAIAASPSGSAARYLLLLWEDEGFTRRAPPNGFAAEYASWARSVAGRGIDISGHELAPERAVVGRASSIEGARSEASVSGYFVVGVDDLEAARQLAEGHPHVGHGGWIEVAAIR